MYTPCPGNQIPKWDEKVFDAFGYREDDFFVEVGANDGVNWSPACMLARAGWAGIFFEPQTRAWNKLVANYGANKSRIQLVKKAISNFTGTTELFLGGSVSTIVEDMKDLYLTI